ncbi:MAG: hypothetical protein LBR08_05375 [Bacteroidales bacterium]|nr:hypothetical protein [Bacteroidales bacterium]
MKKAVILWAALGMAHCISAQTPQELKTKLPRIKGWNVEATVETFDPNTLFERINGAAPNYLLYDFRELTVFVYRQAKGENYVTIQAYRHATPEDAFGIYASERPQETGFVAIGAEGYQEGAMLNFLVNNLYVKIESPSSDAGTVAAVTQIAQAFARKINPKAALPESLQIFPSENKIAHSEQFIAKSFLGHEFLNHAFTADYQASGKNYQVFVINAGAPAEAKAILEKYYRFTGQTDPPKEGRLTVKDRYNGNLECQWKGKYLWGILNDSQAPVKTDEVLKMIEAGIARK